MNTDMQTLMERTNDLFDHYDTLFRKPMKDTDALGLVSDYGRRMVEICREYAYQYILNNPAPSLEYDAMVLEQHFNQALQYITTQSAFQRHVRLMARLQPALQQFKSVLRAMQVHLDRATLLNSYHPY